MSRYSAAADFSHGRPGRIGVLLCNLGTPDAPEPGALRRYLREFLWDPRVVEVPRPIWWLVLNLVILNIRPRRSAPAYAKVWMEEGSPLMVWSRAQRDSLDTALSEKLHVPVSVALAMRYGKPSIAEGLASLRDSGATRVVVLPLYPQYSGSTTGSVFDAVSTTLSGWRHVPHVRFVSDYYKDPGYINALVESIKEHWTQHGRDGHLLFSFHGIPQRYFDAGDPYHCHCHGTAYRVASHLGLADQDWTLSFQSRFGREPWLKPYTDQTLRALAARGIERVAVICPGFASDCIETLEEIDMENRAEFLGAGGKQFHYIPCLNARESHIDALADLVVSQSVDWVADLRELREDSLAGTRERAIAAGAPQ